MKRIRVPEEMLKAALIASGLDDYCSDDQAEIRKALEAALLWLSEHPQVPTDEQVEECRKLHRYEFDPMKPLSVYKAVAVEWQRRCFVQEEPQIPAEIEDLLFTAIPGTEEDTVATNQAIVEAYRRGMRKGEQK